MKTITQHLNRALLRPGMAMLLFLAWVLEVQAESIDADCARHSDKPLPAAGTDELPGIDAFVALDQEPRPLNMDEVKRLSYSQSVRDAGVSGLVVVRVLVDRQGRCVRHEILNSGSSVLSSALSGRLSKLKYAPAMKNQKPVATWVNLPFLFKSQ